METSKLTLVGDACRKYGLAFLVVLAAFGCSDDEEGKKNEEAGVSEVTLNGGRYSNLTAKSTTAAVAVFNPQENITSITYSAFSGDDEFLIVIAYPGNASGQEPWNEDDCYAYTGHVEGTTVDHSVSASYLKEDNGVHTGFVKIDKYGSVGGLITGSFEGNVTIIDGECQCMTDGTMKGTFQAERIQ